MMLPRVVRCTPFHRLVVILVLMLYHFSKAASVFGDATSAFVAATSDVGSVVDSALAEATGTY